MSILNVVQPDEFSDAFETIDDKLQPKISLIEGNILSLFPDGLYTPISANDSVPGRYYYSTLYNGIVEHKGILIDLKVTNGALTGSIYAGGGAVLSGSDLLIDGLSGRAMPVVRPDSGDEILKLPFGRDIECIQRFILNLHRNGQMDIWSIAFTVTAPHPSDEAVVTVIIDEM